jgi:hypothetical protein
MGQGLARLLTSWSDSALASVCRKIRSPLNVAVQGSGPERLCIVIQLRRPIGTSPVRLTQSVGTVLTTGPARTPADLYFSAVVLHRRIDHIDQPFGAVIDFRRLIGLRCADRACHSVWGVGGVARFVLLSRSALRRSLSEGRVPWMWISFLNEACVVGTVLR